MKLILAFCCSALINPFYPMVETSSPYYPFTLHLLRSLASLLAGGTVAQTLGCLAAYFLIEDFQAGGMLADLIIQHLSYCLLGCAFIILSLSNLLIKRGVFCLKTLRLPSLALIAFISIPSFLLIPRMDYLRETALQDGMPVMLSPFANYFATLNTLTFLLVGLQIFFSALLTWKLSKTQST